MDFWIQFCTLAIGPLKAVYCYNEYEEDHISQIMSLVSRYEFQKCVDRYKGDWHTKSFTCFDQFKVMSFAQFTDRSGLRDIEMTLGFCGKELYHSGLCPVPKSTLAEANEKRNWMIYKDFAQVLIREAKELYRDDYFRLGLK